MTDAQTRRGRPYLDFYETTEHLPFVQDISDLARHYSRRSGLYRALGIPPASIAGKRIIEFGPGAGENAQYSTSLRPKRFVLVEANPRAGRETRARLSSVATTDVLVVEALAEEFETDERFDIVLAENMIPGQHDPAGFLRRLARFADSGGLLVMTCSDAASTLSELGLRALARRLVPPGIPSAQRVARLAPIVAPHIAALPGMSRPATDWIVDNIEHPLDGHTFPMSAAIAALSDDFEIYASSPRFFTDWRWYKDVWGEARAFNERAINEYERNILNFIDRREIFGAHPAEFGRLLLGRCYDFFRALQRLEESSAAWDPDMVAQLEQIAHLVAPLASPAASAIEELASHIAGGDANRTPSVNFATWWGRGTQYLSFIRR